MRFWLANLLLASKGAGVTIYCNVVLQSMKAQFYLNNAHACNRNFP